ncbi:MAG: hypothetical protein RBS73_05630 [Prolixibacteraceae bacterium]|jgi:hypothetical protein|nr:hypothetical protein [Prolixibacteraceae bacterium]
MQNQLTGNSENIPKPPPVPKPPTIIDGMMQPGFPTAKVFTCFFLSDCMVFVKTGSISTDTAGSIRSFFGGYTSDALLLGAVGGLVDDYNRQKRMKNAARAVAWDPRQMVAAHKRNFMLPYNLIHTIEIKGPNFAGEARVVVDAGKIYKFRLNRQSKASFAYYERIFNDFLPGKIKKK